MTKGRTFFMLMVALLLAVAAAMMANRWLQGRTAVAGENPGVPVVVASLELPFGKRVAASDVRVVSLPEGAVPKGSFNDVTQVEGRVVTQALFPGEPLIEHKVVEHYGGSALAAVVSPEKRAVTVRVNDVIGVAGFLLPNNRVDVLASRQQGRHQYTAETLLENIKVLAVDQTASPDKDEPVIVRAVTLELSPSEAETLVKATQEGTLQLTLRNPLDATSVAKKEKKVEKAVVAVAPKRRDYGSSVVVIKGMRVEQQRIR